MFKFNWFSWKKAPVATGEIEKSFNVRDGGSNLYNISMNDDADTFVDITYKKLSYAEVAALSKDKKQTSMVSKPRPERVNHNQFLVLADEPEDMDGLLIEERFKTNNYFKKNKQYKEADKKKKVKKIKLKN